MMIITLLSHDKDESINEERTALNSQISLNTHLCWIDLKA